MREIVIIDGGTGAELQRRGVPMDPICWYGRAALTHQPELVSVHVDFINAGARVIIANTFATHRYVLRAGGYEADTERATTASIAAARRARLESGADVRIAGSMSCMPPGIFEVDYPNEATARASYDEHARMLHELGVDLIALEMIQDPCHGSWALDAALQTGLPVWLGISCRAATESGQLVCFDQPDVPLDALLNELLVRRPEFVNIMHTPIDVVPDAIDCVRAHWDGPIGAYPEIGSYVIDEKRRTGRTSPEDFATEANKWTRSGVSLLGGCCGASPEHIAALSNAIN